VDPRAAMRVGSELTGAVLGRTTTEAETRFREWISGKRRGLEASAARAALKLAEWPYRFAVLARGAAYDRGWKRIHRASVPVVSVGNLTAGGTGKTPVVAWLARRFLDRGLRVVLLSRGYRAGRDGRNDEAMELAERLPGVPHIQNADRVAGAAEAEARFQPDLLLLDDGFQHRRLHRDLDIVLIDALEPFGHDHLLPRGLLREPLTALRRAHVIGLTRADLVDAATRDRVMERIGRYGAEAAPIEIAFQPSGLWDGERIEPMPVSAEVGAFCGIGNPDGFRRTLEQLGWKLAAFRTFPDHYRYEPADLADLDRWSAALTGADRILCTRKDWVKLGRATLGNRPLRALTIEPAIVSGLDAFERALDAAILPRARDSEGIPRSPRIDPSGTSNAGRRA